MIRAAQPPVRHDGLRSGRLLTDITDMTSDESIRWIAEIFETSPDELTPETSRDDIPTWDSLGVLTLMASMDEKFGIMLSESDLKGMTKVDDILEVLRRNGKIDS